MDKPELKFDERWGWWRVGDSGDYISFTGDNKVVLDGWFNAAELRVMSNHR